MIWVFLAQRNYKAAAVVIIVVIVIFVGVTLALNSAVDGRPLDEKIETQFSMTLPTNVRNVGYWNWSWDGYVTLAKFTVDAADIEQTLESVQWAHNRCISEEKTEDFMPAFYTDPSIDWWTPFNATEFEGVTCNLAAPDAFGPNFNVMVDYSVEGEATVYIELYSTDHGRRALYNG